eukprot:356295-Chlamydomonas_euryale.AAC.5
MPVLAWPVAGCTVRRHAAMPCCASAVRALFDAFANCHTSPPIGTDKDHHNATIARTAHTAYMCHHHSPTSDNAAAILPQSRVPERKHAHAACGKRQAAPGLCCGLSSEHGGVGGGFGGGGSSRRTSH